MKKITKDWLDSAKLDLDNIELIITREYLTPVMCFHAQQAVEKSFKAYLEEKEIRFSTLSPGFLSQKTRKSLRLCAFA